MIKIIETFENCFDLIEDLNNKGLIITMTNSRCWKVNGNKAYRLFDNIRLPNLCNIEIEGDTRLYSNYDCLGVLCEFLETILNNVHEYYIDNPSIPEKAKFDYSKYIL